MITDKALTRISRFLSLVLRHRPEQIGITLDENGWTDVGVLIERANAANIPLNLDLLKQIVVTNNKQRFTFNTAFNKIRASQGHSVQVELGYRPKEPPAYLYHGTSTGAVRAILETGIHKRNRHHVHLSGDVETAAAVGQRHGPAVVLKVMTGQMFLDGYLFYLSDNNVWLTDHVPARYLEQLSA